MLLSTNIFQRFNVVVSIYIFRLMILGIRNSPFDIELVFLDDFSEDEQKVWHRIARRWEAVIQMDIPDYDVP